jgi:Mg2+ and Co2+ transporter CorA
MENQCLAIIKKLKSAEQSVNLRLDTSRNQLLVVTTALSVFSLSVAFSGYITGVFGMNLDNTIYIQPVRGCFMGIFLSSLFSILLLSTAIIYLLQKYEILPSSAKVVS